MSVLAHLIATRYTRQKMIEQIHSLPADHTCVGVLNNNVLVRENEFIEYPFSLELAKTYYLRSIASQPPKSEDEVRAQLESAEDDVARLMHLLHLLALQDLNPALEIMKRIKDE